MRDNEKLQNVSLHVALLPGVVPVFKTPTHEPDQNENSSEEGRAKEVQSHSENKKSPRATQLTTKKVG